MSVNLWSTCILEAIQEMVDRLQQQQRVMQSMAHNARTGGLSQDALLDKCEALEHRLVEAKQKMANAEMQRSLLGGTADQIEAPSLHLFSPVTPFHWGIRTSVPPSHPYDLFSIF